LLDVSRATTGTLFFVPSLTFLEAVTAQAAGPTVFTETSIESSPSGEAANDGSLGIGSLKGLARDE
jgi:putative iron-dependent peroxidase